MTEQIPVEMFRQSLLIVLDEIFESVHGYLLDPNTSFFDTLGTISAEEASKPISMNSACLAAQVNHSRFYLDMMMDTVKSGEYKDADWASSWRVGPVDDAEWQDLIDQLRSTYQEVRAFASTFDRWDAQFVGGAFALVGHCAYHLGEIRQGLGVLRG